MLTVKNQTIGNKKDEQNYEAFEKLDIDGSGHIEFDEMMVMARNSSNGVADEREIENFMMTLDTDRDGCFWFDLCHFSFDGS